MITIVPMFEHLHDGAIVLPVYNAKNLETTCPLYSAPSLIIRMLPYGST
jgi:hypothetical protein